MTNNELPSQAIRQTQSQVSEILSDLRNGKGDGLLLRRKLIEAAQQKFYAFAKARLSKDRDLAKRHVAEEIVNETISDRIFRKNDLNQDMLDKHQFESSEDFFRFVNKSTFYCLRDLERAYGKVVTKYRKQQTNSPNEKGIQPVEDGIEQSYRRHQRRSEILQAMESLDEDDRTLLQMKFFDEMSRDEIAAALQVTARQVNRREAAAREKLGAILRERSTGVSEIRTP